MATATSSASSKEDGGFARRFYRVTDYLLGRNTLIGPGFATVDLQVSRDIVMGGSRAIQLRFEVFNLFNRTNFGLPATALFNTNGTYRTDAGRITSTAGAARQMQLGVKYVF